MGLSIHESKVNPSSRGYSAMLFCSIVEVEKDLDNNNPSMSEERFGDCSDLQSGASSRSCSSRTDEAAAFHLQLECRIGRTYGLKHSPILGLLGHSKDSSLSRIKQFLSKMLFPSN